MDKKDSDRLSDNSYLLIIIVQLYLKKLEPEKLKACGDRINFKEENVKNWSIQSKDNFLNFRNYRRRKFTFERQINIYFIYINLIIIHNFDKLIFHPKFLNGTNDNICKTFRKINASKKETNKNKNNNSSEIAWDIQIYIIIHSKKLLGSNTSLFSITIKIA